MTVSKAFEKSRMVTSTCLRLSKEVRKSWMVVSIWVSQENPVRKPWFRLVSILWVSRWEMMLQQMMCSRILHGTQVREMCQ